MDNYLTTIKIAIAVFPLIALLISGPFILWQYHKYGGISFFKGAVIYTFVLYLTCAYFLIILPLPKISEVAAITSPTMRLVPFSFVGDFLRETSFNLTNLQSFLPSLAEACVYVPLYNILLTVPFGFYLRYYFRLSLGKVVLCSFLLSLFFELTQLSGLYFIYPRGYRLFDVDDLLLNTLGGLAGYFVATPFLKILPSRTQLNQVSRKNGLVVSGLRRTAALCLDVWIVMACGLLLEQCFPDFSNSFSYFWWVLGLGYYFLLPIILNGATIAEKFLHLRVVNTNGEGGILVFYKRNLGFLVIFVLPWTIFDLVKSNNFMIFMLAIAATLIDIVEAIRLLFTIKPMLHERMSGTRLVSTIE